MAIFSEGKGVIMWLKSKGNDEKFGNYLLSLFKKETKQSFYKVGYKPLNGEKFHGFFIWYNQQDIKQLKKEFISYSIEKQKLKEQSLENYYKSELHFSILANTKETLNSMYKDFKNTMRYGEFKAAYKKSKNYIKKVKH